MVTNATTQTGNYLLLPETVVETNGAGPALDLGTLAGRPVLIVLRIAEIVEQESVQVSVWGSADGSNWGDQALFTYPQKFYRGATPAALDLRQRPEIKFLQARWELNRWGRGYPRPYFKLSIEVQELATG